MYVEANYYYYIIATTRAREMAIIIKIYLIYNNNNNVIIIIITQLYDVDNTSWTSRSGRGAQVSIDGGVISSEPGNRYCTYRYAPRS